MIGRRERRASSARSSAAARVKTSTRRTANDRTRLPSIDRDARAFPTLTSNGSGLVDPCKITMVEYGCKHRTAASARPCSPPSSRSYGLMRRYRRRWIDSWANCKRCPFLRIRSVQLRTKSRPFGARIVPFCRDFYDLRRSWARIAQLRSKSSLGSDPRQVGNRRFAGIPSGPSAE